MARMVVLKDAITDEAVYPYTVAEGVLDENGNSVIAQLKSDLGELQSMCIDKSINLYNATLQTEDTISPHYYVNGKPYETTDFDRSYNCTALIEVKPNTQYTLALVPSFNGYSKPWVEATHGLFFYDESGNYLNKVNENTFTTPTTCKYIRFNYVADTSYGGIDLDVINERCMLVESDTIPTEYVPYYHITIKDRVDELEDVANSTLPIAYGIEEDTISIVSKYGTKELEVVLNKHGGNNLFDFKRFSVIENNNKTLLQNVPSDWHAPFIFKAVNNADGDDISRADFTGGNHEYTSTGSGGEPNARTTLLKFFADGREVTGGTGYANNIKIVWTNLVQGYNTQKADGTGREILQENHCLTFDGLTWTSEVDLIPLEDIFMQTWYGLQFSGLNETLYPNIRYKGATNRGLYIHSTSCNCGDNTANEMIVFGDEHKLTLGIDSEIDLGDSKYYSGVKRFFSTTYGKGYAFIIENQNMYANNLYSLKGYYKFEPMN